jgi:hypothetical protein
MDVHSLEHWVSMFVPVSGSGLVGGWNLNGKCLTRTVVAFVIRLAVLRSSCFSRFRFQTLCRRSPTSGEQM